MAAIVSAQNGNWSATSTWTGAVVPGDGDTVTISHDVDIDQDVTIGISGASGTECLTLVDTTLPDITVTVKAGYTLTVRDDIGSRNGSYTKFFVFEAGSHLVFDKSAATDPTNQQCKFDLCEGGSDPIILQMNGTSGSRCSISSHASGGNGYITCTSAFFETAETLKLNYVDISDLGGASTPCFKWPGDVNLDIQHCTFDSCGDIRRTIAITDTVDVVFQNNTFTNSVGTYNLWKTLEASSAKTTNSRICSGNVFDLHCLLNDMQDFEMEDNVFLNWIAHGGFAGRGTDTFARNVIQATVQQTNIVNIGANGAEDNLCYVTSDIASNPHFFSWKYNENCTVSGSIWEYGGTDHQGDGQMIGAVNGAATLTLKNCIGLPNAAGDTSGVLLGLQGGADTTIRVEHNTCCDAGIMIGEGTYAGHAGIVEYCKSNITWHASGSNYWKAWQYVGNTVTDLCASEDLDFNCGHNIDAGDSGNGYNNWTHSSGTPGTNDIDEDPQFVDRDRDLASWDTSLGGAGTAENAITEMAKRNDSDFDSNYTVANFKTYLHGGFKPQNYNLYQTSHDGTDIGAVPMDSIPSMSPSPSGSPSSSPSSSPSTSPSVSPSSSPSSSPSASPSPSSSPSTSPSTSPSASPSSSPSTSPSPSSSHSVIGLLGTGMASLSFSTKATTVGFTKLKIEAPEQGTYAIVVSIVDKDGEDLIPNTLLWSLMTTQGTIINNRLSVAIAVLSASMTIVLQGDDLKIRSSKTMERLRILTIVGTYDSDLGTDLPLTAECEFAISRFVGIS